MGFNDELTIKKNPIEICLYHGGEQEGFLYLFRIYDEREEVVLEERGFKDPKEAIRRIDRLQEVFDNLTEQRSPFSSDIWEGEVDSNEPQS